MDTIQCAVVLAKLERFDWEVDRRIHIGQRYNEMLTERNIVFVKQREDRTSVFAQYTVLLDDREGTQAKLERAGVPTAVHYPVPLNEQPAYRGLCVGESTPNAKFAAKSVMSLPMGPDLTEIAMLQVVNSIA